MFELPKEVVSQKILFVALNWGDGHAMRSIVILNKLLSQKNEIFVLATSRQLKIYEYYLPELKYFTWNGFQIMFNGSGCFEREIMKNSYRWWKDQRALQQLVKSMVSERSIDMVLADHVYGLGELVEKSIFITHQVRYRSRYFTRIINFFHQRKIAKYNEVWILDNQQNELAGDMSKVPQFTKYYYIGWPSRFALGMNIENEKKISDKQYVVYLLTGPEPYKTQLLHLYLIQLNSGNENTKLIGLSDHGEQPINASIECVSFENQARVDYILQRARVVHSRGGYTTYLDQKQLGFDMINYPTPGQYEQQYLNSIHKKKASK